MERRLRGFPPLTSFSQILSRQSTAKFCLNSEVRAGVPARLFDVFQVLSVLGSGFSSGEALPWACLRTKLLWK